MRFNYSLAPTGVGVLLSQQRRRRQQQRSSVSVSSRKIVIGGWLVARLRCQQAAALAQQRGDPLSGITLIYSTIYFDLQIKNTN